MKAKRPPAFVNSDAAPVQFGAAGHYLWGNIPAYDCLNLPSNEGMEKARNQDFNLAFAGEKTEFLPVGDGC